MGIGSQSEGEGSVAKKSGSGMSPVKPCWLRLKVTSQNPSEWSAQLLLGLESINSSKNDQLTEPEKARSFLAGTKLIEKAFHANNRSAAAANALCELFLRKGNHSRVGNIYKELCSTFLTRF